MNDQLREYIDTIFIEAPRSMKAVEIKEEILQNLHDKYYDLLAEGKSEEAAYNIAIASIGDFSELIDELKQEEVPNMDDQTKRNQRSAILTAVSIALYILSVIPVILFEGKIGPILLFVFIAAATGILIYNNMTKQAAKTRDATMAEDFREWRASSSEKQKVYKSITAALWALTLVIYFLVSFLTMNYWHLTWLIFPIAGAINSIIKAMFDLKK